jgi:hypothetical protein
MRIIENSLRPFIMPHGVSLASAGFEYFVGSCCADLVTQSQIFVRHCQSRAANNGSDYDLVRVNRGLRKSSLKSETARKAATTSCSAR